jgi:hypothetical protein
MAWEFAASCNEDLLHTSWQWRWRRTADDSALLVAESSCTFTDIDECISDACIHGFEDDDATGKIGTVGTS